jgi:uncharacterized membrane protein (GlpM family)
MTCHLAYSQQLATLLELLSAHWLASTNNRYQRAKCAIHMHNWQSCSFLNQLLSEFVLRIKLPNSVQSRVDEYGLASYFLIFCWSSLRS